MSDDGAAPAQDASPNAAPPRGAAIAEARGKRAYWFAAAAFTALILLVGALFLGIASAQRSADQARALATENGEITRQAELVQRLTVSTEASLRGYLLTDTPFYLESARRSLPNADAAMARLQTLAAAVPVLEAQVDAIAQRRAEALTAIRSSIGRLDAPARRRVVSLLREDDGRRMMRLGAAVADLRAMTATRQLAAAARIERASQRVNALLISLSAVFVAMIAVSIAFFVRETGVLLRVVRHLNRANAALLQARAAAEEADAAKTRFLAMASHDMRQPLHALTLYLAALRRRVDGAQALDILTRMEQAAGALTQMFTGLLDLARIESGVLKPAPTEFRLNDVFNALRAELHDDAERARVVLKILPTSAVLHSDRDMTASILRNLLTNALKYAPGGRVLMGCRRQGDRLRIEVHDEGEGIPEEKIAMLFDEFVRLDQVGPREGLGLGLAIASKLCFLLGMSIRVISPPGKGAVFTVVTPPLARSADPPAAVAPARAMASVRGFAIAIADDDPFSRAAMARALEDAGARAHVFENVEALDQALRGGARFQLAIAGPEILAKAKGGSDEFPPTLVLTGATDAATLTALQATDGRWLVKPVHEEELIATAAQTAARRSLIGAR